MTAHFQRILKLTLRIGRHVLRNSVFGRLDREFNAERSQQYLPGQSRNVTYITRLQSMQAAIDKQIKQMRCG